MTTEHSGKKIVAVTVVLFVLVVSGLLASAGALRRAREADLPPPLPAPPAPAPTAGDTDFSYHGPVFTGFVEDSYRAGRGRDARGGAGAEEFYQWIERAYGKAGVYPKGMEMLTLEGALAEQRKELAAITDPTKRTAAELELAAWLHRLTKRILPNFSLEQGFEFRYAVRYLERQCLLQSVLIAGLLQGMGADAGVVMVFRNQNGEESNLGHVAAVLRLSNGRDLLIDASDPEPFMRHRGVFARANGYRFLSPVYEKDVPQINAYRYVSGKGQAKPREVKLLDAAYVRSQFWYYRGEREPGGAIASPTTPEGLQASARDLEAAVHANAWNPLATYMLGRVYLKQGERAKARETLTRAHALYAADGLVPPGPKQALAEARRRSR